MLVVAWLQAVGPWTLTSSHQDPDLWKQQVARLTAQPILFPQAAPQGSRIRMEQKALG